MASLRYNTDGETEPPSLAVNVSTIAGIIWMYTYVVSNFQVPTPESRRLAFALLLSPLTHSY
jgi:hypothetical protein